MLKLLSFLKQKSCISLFSTCRDTSPLVPAPTIITNPANLPTFISGLIRKQGFYVDRSACAERILKSEHTLMRFTGPNRIGKTTFLQLLQYFCSKYWGSTDNSAIGNIEFLRKLGTYHTAMLNFSKLRTTDPVKLEADLLDMIHGIRYLDQEMRTIKTAMKDLLSTMGRGVSDLILIDDWDYPLQTEDPRLFRANLEILEQFFAPARGDCNKRMVLAGSSSVARTEHRLYEDIVDISNDPELAPRLGFTEEEVRTIFSKAVYPDLTIEDNYAFLSQLKKHYEGLALSPGNPKVKVYNPFSVAQCKKTAGIIGQYWLNANMLETLKSFLPKFPYYLDPEDIEVEYDINTQEVRLDSKLLSPASAQVVRVLWEQGIFTVKSQLGFKYVLRPSYLEASTSYNDLITRELLLTTDIKWKFDFWRDFSNGFSTGSLQEDLGHVFKRRFAALRTPKDVLRFLYSGFQDQETVQKTGTSLKLDSDSIVMNKRNEYCVFIATVDEKGSREASEIAKEKKIFTQLESLPKIEMKAVVIAYTHECGLRSATPVGIERAQTLVFSD